MKIEGTVYSHPERGASRPVFGLMAEFQTPAALLHATREARGAGYVRLDAYSPFPVEGLAEAVGLKKNRVSFIVLGGGLLGCALAYFMQWYANIFDYVLNVGGRPFHSWPSFIPITFEFAILCASFAAVIGFLALNGLPRLYHPVFEAPNFERASQDRFFLCIEARDERFDAVNTQHFLESLDATSVNLIRRRER